MNTLIKITLPLLMLFILSAFISQTFHGLCESEHSQQLQTDTGKKEKNKDGKKKKNDITSSAIQVTNTWEMPAILREISGIAYIDSDHFACIQDELGTIFIYNTKSDKIEREIPFGEAGDYEGIALVGKTAYILRSDGRLYEVNNATGSSPSVNHYDTFLTIEQDVEGLCYDAKHNRLLLAIKGIDPFSQDFKGIYAFDLISKKLLNKPVFKLPITASIFQFASTKNNKKATVQPSDIEIHPVSGEIYLTEAAHYQIMVLDMSGTLKTTYPLGRGLFAKPEGITFTPTGKLFISNEGKKGNGNILEVKIVEKAEK